jgi:AraC-like DNA-binding protein
MFSLALSLRPRLVHAGVGVHGDPRRESFVMGDLWALHAYPYEAEVEVSGWRGTIRPGTVSLTPPGVKVVYSFPRGAQHRYAHFRLARGAAERMRLPFLQDEPGLYARVWAGLARVARARRERPGRAEVALWELLWDVAEAGEEAARPQGTGDHPALAAALGIIDEELARPLSLAGLARRVGVSQTHLIRLFRARFGVPVAAYVRERRVEKAEHLLRHTGLPFKAVAAQVGLGGPQAFNKVLRRLRGRGPRALRAAGDTRDPA